MTTITPDPLEQQFNETPDDINTGVTSQLPEVLGRRSVRRAKLVAQDNMRLMPGSYVNSIKYKGNMGRWEIEEHIQFLEGIKKHGKNWKLVEKHVPSRTGSQIRSHAQKFFKRIRPNWIGNEKEIECLRRTNFSIDIILSGTEEKEDKEELARRLEDRLQQDPSPCSCDEIINRKSGKTSDPISELTNDQVDKTASKGAEVESTPKHVAFEGISCSANPETEEKLQENKFSYFPSSYKMSIVDPAARKVSEDFNLPAPSIEQEETCIQLQPIETDTSGKRKRSEMVRLDKLVKNEDSIFHAPSPKDQSNLSGKKRPAQTMNKFVKRQRIMTECVNNVNSRIGFKPTQSSEMTMTSILRLRDKQYPKPSISRCLNLLTHRLSTDSASMEVHTPSRVGRVANVVLLRQRGMCDGGCDGRNIQQNVSSVLG